MVTEIFWEEDTELILSIPVHTDGYDFPAWHLDSRGIFTVKSAYKLFWDLEKKAHTQGPAADQTLIHKEEAFWRKLRKMPILNKMKHFLWRMAHDSLALRANLERRGMKIGTQCVVCTSTYEDGAHLFFKCKCVREIWRSLGMRNFEY